MVLPNGGIDLHSSHCVTILCLMVSYSSNATIILNHFFFTSFWWMRNGILFHSVHLITLQKLFIGHLNFLFSESHVLSIFFLMGCFFLWVVFSYGFVEVIPIFCRVTLSLQALTIYFFSVWLEFFILKWYLLICKILNFNVVEFFHLYFCNLCVCVFLHVVRKLFITLKP